ncbi:energy-coupling factor transporter transmembrane protein EcfT [Cellulomonas sp. DKR-3]|uniref:Energy-coupling factor transporter transmembrane protein EcfT n=1 Tax=Cellulomonas fulva TaxID=2835530 RepID=A0ABS5U1N8_9CELL|nr:energy-coupling factor transporter transmembrane component T [Cellulomonas fulva]MBT0995299.1 energy-coupling factor transporter transmembrane protein EcfT [Cellulomonas fulva]
MTGGERAEPHPAPVGRPLRAAWTGPLGLHQPGTSVLHRAPTAAKLVSLALAGLAVVVLRGPASSLLVLALAVVAHAVARLAWHRTRRGLAGTAVVALVVGGYQTWARGWEVGVETAAGLLALVLLATVVTATTRADELLATLERAARPLRHVGIAPETVALAVSLLLRSVPVLVHATLASRDAARARGLERSPRAVVVPAAVRMVGHARATGEALAARGLGEGGTGRRAETAALD